MATRDGGHVLWAVVLSCDPRTPRLLLAVPEAGAGDGEARAPRGAPTAGGHLGDDGGQLAPVGEARGGVDGVPLVRHRHHAAQL